MLILFIWLLRFGLKASLKIVALLTEWSTENLMNICVSTSVGKTEQQLISEVFICGVKLPVN